MIANAKLFNEEDSEVYADAVHLDVSILNTYEVFDIEILNLMDFRLFRPSFSSPISRYRNC